MSITQTFPTGDFPVATDSYTVALLVFKVGEQTYGLPVDIVTRIIDMVTITPWPGLSQAIQGLINVRGKVVPVVDLRRRFGLPPHAYGLHTPIILVDMAGNGSTLGLIVDEVKDVIQVSPSDLELTETLMPAELLGALTTQAAHLAGVAKVNRQLILLLEARALLSPLDYNQLAQAQAKIEAVDNKDGF